MSDKNREGLPVLTMSDGSKVAIRPEAVLSVREEQPGAATCIVYVGDRVFHIVKGTFAEVRQVLGL